MLGLGLDHNQIHKLSIDGQGIESTSRAAAKKTYIEPNPSNTTCNINRAYSNEKLSTAQPQIFDKQKSNLFKLKPSSSSGRTSGEAIQVRISLPTSIQKMQVFVY